MVTSMMAQDEGTRPRAADDFEEIRKNLFRVQGRCFLKHFRSAAGCWCLKAGPDGRDLPCSSAKDDSAMILSEVSCG